jgi:hypothetical protein
MLKNGSCKAFVVVDREGDQLSNHEPRKSAALRHRSAPRLDQGERISGWHGISTSCLGGFSDPCGFAEKKVSFTVLA